LLLINCNKGVQRLKLWLIMFQLALGEGLYGALPKLESRTCVFFVE